MKAKKKIMAKIMAYRINEMAKKINMSNIENINNEIMKEMK